MTHTHTLHKRLGGSQRPGFRSTNRRFPIFNRTDLRIGVSGERIHEETDFGIQNCLAPPKSRKKYEKQISETQKNQIVSESFFRRFGGRQAS